jgi:hypothetical protein
VWKYECNCVTNTAFTYKILTSKHIGQGFFETRSILCTGDWKRESGVLVLSDFKYGVLSLFVLRQDNIGYCLAIRRIGNICVGNHIVHLVCG